MLTEFGCALEICSNDARWNLACGEGMYISFAPILKWPRITASEFQGENTVPACPVPVRRWGGSEPSCMRQSRFLFYRHPSVLRWARDIFRSFRRVKPPLFQVSVLSSLLAHSSRHEIRRELLTEQPRYALVSAERPGRKQIQFPLHVFVLAPRLGSRPSKRSRGGFHDIELHLDLG